MFTRRFRAVCSCLNDLMFVCLFAALSSGIATAANLPPGFTETQIVSGLNAPTTMAFAPDGRLFVCEQGGKLRVIKNGRLNSTPFVTLAVNSEGERGLLGVAFDPNFVFNQFVYVYYTAPTPNIHNRVSRFTASGDTAIAGSEVVLLDLDPLSSKTNHNGGALRFGIDGKLYIAVGENNTPSNSQTLANLLGKLLRINSDGSIPTDNPFYAQATGKNRAIWALGLRNPYTFAFRPNSDFLFINDVGRDTWEEINRGIAGANYGWPATEGPTQNPDYVSPVFAYGHGNGDELGCSIIGGDFYEPTQPQFPAEYSGLYFFADFCNGWIRTLDPNDNTVKPFATGLAMPVTLQVGQQDGALYYLSRGDGAVYAIGYPRTLLPSADAYVKSGAAADTNFGGKNELIVKRSASTSSSELNRISYLRFDLRGVTTPPQSAQLQLFVGANSNPAGATVQLNVYAVPNSPWTETTLTWNNAPGLDRTNVTSTGRLLGTITVPVQSGQVTLDVTSFVRGHLGDVVTLQLLNNINDNVLLSLQSKENAAEKPQLVLGF